MKARKAIQPQSGFALVIVLWATVLLSLIAASFAFSMRVETQLTGNLVERTKAQAIADAGIQRGVFELLTGSQESRWIADGRRYVLPFGDGTMRIRLIAENGKVDLNGAPEPLIHGLVRALLESGDQEDERRATAIADAILDWRDADHDVRASGAEDRHYQSSGRHYGARDGAFLSVEELNQVLPLDAAIYAKLAPFVTVYAWAPQVDPMTAPRTVLLGVPGLDSERVDQFLAAREALYAGRGESIDAVQRLPLELLSPGARYLSRAQARVYTVEAEGEVGSGARASRRAVIQLTGDQRRPYSIVAWFASVPYTSEQGEIRKGE